MRQWTSEHLETAASEPGHGLISPGPSDQNQNSMVLLCGTWSWLEWTTLTVETEAGFLSALFDGTSWSRSAGPAHPLIFRKQNLQLWLKLQLDPYLSSPCKPHDFSHSWTFSLKNNNNLYMTSGWQSSRGPGVCSVSPRCQLIYSAQFKVAAVEEAGNKEAFSERVWTFFHSDREKSEPL